MTDNTLPPPLVPAEVDLRDFGFMPMHVQRLRDSELAVLSTGDEFKAAVLLWAFSWHQRPAGSLPNDDRILAARSGADAAWRKVKEMALRGFIECSDGRLYHPLIAESALDAWERRDAYQERQSNRETRQQRWRAELARLSDLLRKAGVTPPQRPTKTQLQDLCRRHGVDVDVDACVDAGETRVDAGEIAKTGTGTGTGTEEEIPSLLPQAPALPADDRPPLALVGSPEPPSGPPDCPHQAVLALWGEVLPQLPQHLASQWRGTRADHLRARWRETAVDKRWTSEAQGLAYLRKLFAYVGQSDFLTGRSKPQPGKRPFVIELEWLVNPTNWAKVHEGKYHGEAA